MSNLDGSAVILLALLIGFCAVIGALFGSALIGLAIGLGLALAAQAL